MSIVIDTKEVYTDAPDTKRVHRIGTENYFSRCTKLTTDTAEDFEEVNVEDVPNEETEELEDEAEC